MMKRKLYLLLSGAMLYGSSLTVYADTGNAVSDIMNDTRFEGAMSTIDWLSGFIDHYMTMAITLVAFFIISMALFRNVCAAAYCSNSKFWNKVAEAHEAAEGASLASLVQGIKGLPQKSWGGQGGIKGAILCLIPNIKALTDFDDVDMEPKHYWMKAIPQMLACIIIGVFVYNGYYRDTASVVGEMGSEVISRALASVNPSDMIDTITLTTGTPDNIYEKDNTTLGEMNYEISMELYKAFRSAWDISDTNQKTVLMRNCEAMADNLTRNITYFKVSDVNSNKVMKLTGLHVTTVGASNNGSDNVALGNSTWTGSHGCNGDAAIAFGANQSDGTTYNFSVYHIGPTVNNETTNTSQYYSISSYCKVTGTLVQEDGDQSKQDTSIVASGASVIGGGITINTLGVELTTSEQLENANGGDGRQVPFALIDDTTNFAKITAAVKTALETGLNTENSGGTYAIGDITCVRTNDGKYTATNAYLANFSGGTATFNLKCDVTYTYTFTPEGGAAESEKQATAKAIIPIKIVASGGGN